MSRTFFHRLTPFFKLILVSILLLNFMLLNFSCTKDETADNNSPKETAAQETAASNVDKEDDTMNEEIVSLDNSWPDLPRGSWLTDNSDEGLTLIGDGVECEIVVRKEENSAVHQAAKFLAKDIEKITGICPRIVSHATKGKVTIRLATLDTTEIP